MGMCNFLIAQPPAGAQLRPLAVDQSGTVTLPGVNVPAVVALVSTERIQHC